MAINPRELRAQRAALVKQAREILDKADTEKRELNAEERNKYDAIMQDVDKIGERITAEERLKQIESDLSDSIKPVPSTQAKRSANATEEYRAAMDRYMRSSKAILTPDELRTLNEGSGPKGAYLFTSEMDKRIVELMNNINDFRKYAEVIVTGTDRDIPVASTLGAAAWTGEESAYNESDDEFSQVTLSAYKATRIIKVSEELLADNMFDLEGYLAKSFARAFAQAEEAAFVNGNGSGKPTGLIVGGTLGKTTASASAITSDELIDLYYSLGKAYRDNAVFVLNDATAKVIRQLKNGTTGDYMWMPGLREGEPDKLLGKKVIVSDHVPTITNSAKVIAFGDLSYYWIAQRGGMYLQRLDELYAANGQIGFRGYERVDGKLTNSAAVKYLQMKA